MADSSTKTELQLEAELTSYYQKISAPEQVVAELPQSAERLQFALEAAGAGVWDWNLNSGELIWSEQLQRLCGLVPGSFEGNYEAFVRLVHPADRAAVTEMAMRLSTGEDYDQEFRVVLPDGNVRYLAGKGRPYRVQNGKPERVVGVTFDVSDRKHEEQDRKFLVEASELLNSSLDLEITLKNLSQLLVPRLADWCTVDLEDPAHPQRLQAVVLTHSDSTKEKYIYELKTRFLPEQDETNPMIQTFLTGRSLLIPRIPVELLEAVSAEDDDLRQLLYNLGLISAMYVPLIARGRSLGVLALNTDVGSGRELGEADLGLVEELARRAAMAIDNARLYRAAEHARLQAEAATKRTQRLQEVTAALARVSTRQEVINVMLEQGRAAIDAITSTVILLNSDEATYTVVATSEEGVLTAQWYPSHLPLDDRLPAVEVALTGQPLWMANLATEDWDIRYPDMTRAREVLNRQAYAFVPIRIDEHKLGTLVLGFNEPHTFNPPERELLLAVAAQCAQALERTRLYSNLQAALKDRDEFLSVAAHELKTPLTGLKGFVQLLVRQLDRTGAVEPERLHRSLQVINSQSDKLGRLIDQLLNLSRIQAGKLTLEKQEVDVKQLVEATVITARIGVGNSPNHTLNLIMPDTPVHAWLDPLRFEQVVNNLLDNAIKYSPEGGLIEIKLEQATSPENNDQLPATTLTEPAFLRLTITDWGVGIPLEQRPHIFERFYQAHSKTYISGMGLGLYISRQIVELHEGKISAEFPADGSTQFVVIIPLQAP